MNYTCRIDALINKIINHVINAIKNINRSTALIVIIQQSTLIISCHLLTHLYIFMQATVIPDGDGEVEHHPHSNIVDSNLLVFEKIKPSQLPANQ